MKAKLEFTLPEEREEFETAVNAGKHRSLLDDVIQLLRNEVKYGNGNRTIDDIYKEVCTLYSEAGL